MSLLVFVEDERLSEWARERARLLATRHSSCVLVLNAAVAADAPPADEPDWHEVGVRGKSPEGLQTLAETHLPTGVPRILLWVAPRTASDERFMRLAPEVQTILLDSSRALDDESALRDLVAFRAAEPSNTAVHDLAYLRLAPWQEVVAEFFDAQAFVEDLFDLRRVTIASGSDAEGYYLLGWLASRLGWEPDGERRFRNRKGAREIGYEIEREGQARRVKRIALESHATRFVAELCSNDPGAVSVEVSGAKQRKARVEPLHDVDITSLLERAISHAQADSVFFESLEVAGRLLLAG